MKHPAAGSILATGDGRQRVRLGAHIKSGGAGSVFRVADDTAHVAKVYHADQPLPLYERKIAAMVALTPDLPDLVDGGERYVQIAWPRQLLRDERGRFIGFLMPAVDVDATSELEYILQERQARAHNLPTGLGAKITLAANLAAVIAALHRQGHHVVDMKPVNLRFYPQSLYMAMLDCDGFSIRGPGERFVAPQVTPDYLAPEFQRGGLTAAGEEAQDRFALATIVFQLLNFGLHPYSGRPKGEATATDIPGRIAQRAYPYGRRPHTQMLPSPVSGHETIAADLRVLFDRAFESSGAGRPSAADWATALREHAQRTQGRLVVCGREPEHQHFAGLPCAACARAALIAQTGQRAKEARNTSAARVARAMATAAGTRPIVPGRAPTSPRPTPAAGSGGGTTRPPPRWRPAASGWKPPPAASTYPTPAPRSSAAGSNLIGLWNFLWAPILGSNVSVGAALIVGLMIFVAFLNSPGRQPSRDYDPPTRSAPRPARSAAAPTQPASPPSSLAPAPDSTQMPTLVQTREEIELAISDVLAGHVFRLTASGGARMPVGSADDLRGLPALLALAPAVVRAQIAQRTPALAAAPRDPNLAVELGFLQLLAGDSGSARASFATAIRAAPARPAAWYGLSLAVPDDRTAVGARAIAEILAEKEPRAAGLRAQIAPVQAVMGLDPALWQRIDARARTIAARHLGLAIGEDQRRLASLPLR